MTAHLIIIDECLENTGKIGGIQSIGAYAQEGEINIYISITKIEPYVFFCHHKRSVVILMIEYRIPWSSHGTTGTGFKIITYWISWSSHGTTDTEFKTLCFYYSREVTNKIAAALTCLAMTCFLSSRVKCGDLIEASQ